MIRSVVLLALYFYSTSGQIVSKPYSHYSDALKIKCDALPYRTVHNERNCYFVIDAEGDVSTSNKRCSSALADAKVAQPGKVPEEVWSWLFVDKTSFISDAESKGKIKAMCIFENRFTKSTSTGPRTTIYQGANVTARMVMYKTWKFPQALEVGQTITMKGAFSSQEAGVSFNLQDDQFQTVAVHYIINFDQGTAAFTTRRNGAWDQNYQIFSNPFKRGGAFDVRFRIHDDHVQVFVNREEFGNYKYRIPLSTVSTLGIIALGHFSYVQLGEQYDPVPYSGKLSKRTKVSKPATRMAMPVNFKFPKPLETGQSISFKGMFSRQESRMSFNLQQYDFQTIALHFAIDFNQGTATFSARSNGVWGPNDNQFSHSFKRGGPFHVRFQINEDGVQVFVDEKEYGTYKFRIARSTIDTLGFNGVGVVSYVRLGDDYEPVLNATQAKSPLDLLAEDEKSLLPVNEVFANGFPVCGKQTACSATKQYSSNVSRADCKSLLITGRYIPGLYGYGPPSFFINLKRKNGDIALHFIARFNDNDVVLNTWKATQPGGWQTNVLNKLPLKAGAKFEIAIVNDVHGFQISVDGVYFKTFEHRMCPFDIAEVEVSPFVLDVGIQLQ